MSKQQDSYQPNVDKSYTPDKRSTYQPVNGPKTQPKAPQGGSGVPPANDKK
jgi:hypothetical protein